MEEYVPDALGERRAAGLAGEKNAATARAEAVGKASGLHGFPGGLSPFEREERADHRYIWTRRNGSLPVLRELRFARSTSSCWSLRTYAFCGVSSTSSRAPVVTASIASRVSSSASSSGPRRSSNTLVSALAICEVELLRAT